MTESSVPVADELPTLLVECDQWLCWRSEPRDGKATKVPIEPGTDAFASATDPETWRSFANAREHALATECGVGFVFTADDAFVGVDLDDCRDPDPGTLDTPARSIVERLESYTEVSPSGPGVHVLVLGALPAGRNRRGDVELYDQARFFTVTGEQLADTPASISHRASELAAIHEKYVSAADDSDHAPTEQPPKQPQETVETDVPGNDLNDSEVLDRAKAAANGEKFRRLWRGLTTGYPSHSEADMALCALLAFWTGGDAAQMDRLFRESGLLRPKWDEQHFADGATYGERTIERAIAGTDEYYSTEDVDEWEPLPEQATAAETRSRSDPGYPTGGMDPSPTVDQTLSRLREQLAELEAENERLRKQLAAERARDGDCTADGTSEHTDGLLSRFL